LVALAKVPKEAPDSFQLAVYEDVALILRTLSPKDPERLVRSKVEAAVNRALVPFQKRRQVQDAIDHAVGGMPREVLQNPTWKAVAQQRAAEAVRKAEALEYCDLSLAAKAAIVPVVASCLHEITKGKLIEDWTWEGHWKATHDEREEAKDATRAALEGVPVGTSDKRLRQIRDKAVEHISARVVRREEKQKEQQERRDTRAWAESLVANKLYLIAAYLRKEYELHETKALYALAEPFAEELKPELVERLIDGRLTPPAIQDFIEEWIDDELDDGEEDDGS
jgi:hypothetical protein